MRSEVAKRILARAKPETYNKVRKYADLVNAINEALTEKGWNKKDLAEALGKKPSEISKWLNGEHNLTWNSIIKLEAELDTELIYIPKKVTFNVKTQKKKTTVTVYKNRTSDLNESFESAAKFVYKSIA